MKRRVLVTGGAGFIGSHVVDALLAMGDEVHALDDLSKGHVTNLPDEAPLHVLDIGDPRAGRLMGDVRFDAIVHCAAQTNVMRSIADPQLDRQINVDGLQAVLEAAASTRVGRFVFVSSGGAVYGETPVPAREETPAQPDNPYGEHKLRGERIIAASSVPSVVLRLSNVYGLRQRSDVEGGVIAIFAERLAAGRSLAIYGDGEQQRDFVHVSDVVDAIVLALDDEAMDGIWNVGTGRATTINEVARTMLAAFGSEDAIEHLPPRGEIRRSCLDVSKLTRTGRWRPRRELAQGVAGLVGSTIVRDPS
jgi:UDP-glucose 4-epimerase